METIISTHSHTPLTLEIKTNNQMASILLKFYTKLGFKMCGKTSVGIFLRKTPMPPTLESGSHFEESPGHKKVNKKEDNTLS